MVQIRIHAACLTIAWVKWCFITKHYTITRGVDTKVMARRDATRFEIVIHSWPTMTEMSEMIGKMMSMSSTPMSYELNIQTQFATSAQQTSRGFLGFLEAFFFRLVSIL